MVRVFQMIKPPVLFVCAQRVTIALYFHIIQNHLRDSKDLTRSSAVMTRFRRRVSLWIRGSTESHAPNKGAGTGRKQALPQFHTADL